MESGTGDEGRESGEEEGCGGREEGNVEDDGCWARKSREKGRRGWDGLEMETGWKKRRGMG